MLLLVFFIIFGILVLGVMSQNFFIYSRRDDLNSVKNMSFWFGIGYLVIAVLLFATAFVMMGNNKVQYTVEFNKISK